MAAATPEGDGCPNRRHEEDRVQQAELAAEEVAYVPQGWLPGLSDPRSVGDMEVGNPTMLAIPNQHRQGANHIDQQGQVGSRATQVFARRRPEREEHRPAEQLEQLSVFAQETKSHPQADPQPFPGPRAILHRPPTRQHGRRPEQDGQGIDGHEHPANGHQRSGGDDEQQEEPGAGVDLAGKESKGDQTDDCGDDRGKEPHTEGGVAPQVRPEELHVSDEGGLAVIREREVFRPEPLVGFVLAELNGSAGDVGEPGQQANGDPEIAEAKPMLIHRGVWRARCFGPLLARSWALTGRSAGSLSSFGGEGQGEEVVLLSAHARSTSGRTRWKGGGPPLPDLLLQRRRGSITCSWLILIRFAAHSWIEQGRHLLPPERKPLCPGPSPERVQGPDARSRVTRA